MAREWAMQRHKLLGEAAEAPEINWHGSCLVRRSRAFGDARDYITLVHTFHHWQFFLCACGTAGRQ